MSPSTPVLGVDPGSSNGGLALVLRREVLAWAGYWKRSSGYVVAFSHHPKPRPVESLHMLVTAWKHDLLGMGYRPWRLVVEQLFVPRSNQQQSPQTVVTLGEAAGEMIGPLRHHAADVRRVRAVDWRHQVLELPRRTKAKEAEKVAVREAPALFRWPGNGWDDLQHLAKPALGGVVEAACIADWGDDSAQVDWVRP